MALTDLQREFQLARSQPRHLVPQPKVPLARLRRGLDGVVDSLLAAQHVLEMFRRALPKGPTRECLDRLSNRLTKILSEAANFPRPETEQRLMAGYADNPATERSSVGKLRKRFSPERSYGALWPRHRQRRRG